MRLLLTLLLLLTSGCATLPGDPSKMTAEQLRETVKDKSATASCATVETPYKGNAVFLNLDRTVLPKGTSLTIRPNCEIIIKQEKE